MCSVCSVGVCVWVYAHANIHFLTNWTQFSLSPIFAQVRLCSKTVFDFMCVCVCMRACVHACVHACMHANLHFLTNWTQISLSPIFAHVRLLKNRQLEKWCLSLREASLTEARDPDQQDLPPLDTCVSTRCLVVAIYSGCLFGA